ncbi:MAG: hypothetical protein ACPL07_01020 [Candidatus Bathyarchaeia archaeon]
MSKEGLNKNNSLEIPRELSGLIHKHYDRLLADDSLSDLNVILLALYLIEKNNQKAGAEYNECKKLFITLGMKEKNYPANIHLAKKKGLIETKDRILNFTSKGLKEIRILLGQVEKSPVYVVKSGESFSALMLLEQFLDNEIKAEELLLCDPHISAETLFPLNRLKGKVKAIKILASNIYDDDRFKEYKKRLQKEANINIEVRKNKKIHDRYLISGDKCWSIGAGIKDLGNKDTIIKEISEVTDSLKQLFMERWNESEIVA